MSIRNNYKAHVLVISKVIEMQIMFQVSIVHDLRDAARCGGRGYLSMLLEEVIL